ncbi:hypothetical protein HY571_02845 [Candidatus Micrarchaeota archaeon]|nr:hypothetical protein [Candidatus Micrarchaeota archaeon]
MNLTTAYKWKINELFSEENLHVSRDLLDSLELLKWNVSPRQIVGLSRLCALVTFAAALLVAVVLFSSNPLVFLSLVIISPLAALHYVSEYPKKAARYRVLQAIGEAPKTLVYLIVPLKQNPNLEEAFRFAATHSEGEIASDLKNSLWKTWSGKTPSVKRELPIIAEKWGKFAPEFRHSVYLVMSALSEKSTGARALTLDKAVSYSLDGIVSKMQQYVSKLFVPTLLIFSFGTIIPLMFISLLPLLIYFGIKFSSALEVAAILGAALLALYIYSEKVLLERPPAFSQSSKKPAPVGIHPALLVTLSTLVIGAPGFAYLLAENGALLISPDSAIGWLVYNVHTLSILWGFVIGLSLFYYLQAEPLKKTREEQRKIESELVSTLHQLASRMAEKRPPEEAMQFAASISPESRLGRTLGKASATIKKRSTTLESALFDEKFGAAVDIPSRTVTSALQLFTASCKKGSIACSQVLYTASDYLSRLNKVEQELRSLLSKNISMLRATAIVFAPLVTGIVVTMFELISTSVVEAQQQLASLGYGGTLSTALLIQLPPFSAPVLLLVVGAYMIGLNLVTMRYASFVENGPDEVDYKLETAKALPLSMAVFTIVVIFASSFLAIS